MSFVYDCKEVQISECHCYNQVLSIPVYFYVCQQGLSGLRLIKKYWVGQKVHLGFSVTSYEKFLHQVGRLTWTARMVLWRGVCQHAFIPGVILYHHGCEGGHYMVIQRHLQDCFCNFPFHSSCRSQAPVLRKQRHWTASLDLTQIGRASCRERV